MINNARVIINSLLNNNKYFSSVYSTLTLDDFEDNIDKKIFKTIQTIYMKYNKVPSLSELELWFDSSNNSDKVKKDIITTLENIKEIPINTMNDELLLDSTQKFIKDNRFYRDVVLAGSEMLDGNDKYTTEGLQSKAQEINMINFKKSAGLDYIEDALDNFKEYAKVDEAGIKSNIEIVNIATGGGHKPGTLFLYLAISNAGKTTLLVNEAVSAILQGKNVAYFTFEETELEIRERVDACIMDIKTSELKTRGSTLNTQFQNLIKKGLGKLKIKAYPPRSAGALTQKAQLEDWRLKDGFKADMIISDSITIMAPNAKSDNLYSNGKAVSEEAKGLGVELHVPTVSAVQVGRSGGGYSNSDVGMEDVSESLATIQVATTIVGVMLDDKRPDVRRLNIAKSRKTNKAKVKSCFVNIDTDKQKVWDLNEGERKNMTGTMKEDEKQINELVNTANKIEEETKSGKRSALDSLLGK